LRHFRKKKCDPWDANPSCSKASQKGKFRLTC
jgi:hypothetical protein